MQRERLVVKSTVDIDGVNLLRYWLVSVFGTPCRRHLGVGLVTREAGGEGCHRLKLCQAE
jgi:hypothetical protein